MLGEVGAEAEVGRAMQPGQEAVDHRSGEQLEVADAGDLDARGEFPKREPGYPVLWLVKGRKPVPWGMRVQLN